MSVLALLLVVLEAGLLLHPLFPGYQRLNEGKRGRMYLYSE